MAEEIKENSVETKESCCCNKSKCKFFHKILGLKGLSVIYKILSILVLLYAIYLVGMIWYIALTQDAPKGESAILTLQLLITYGFYALVLLTVARVLKTLKKIKHAVEHK